MMSLEVRFEFDDIFIKTEILKTGQKLNFKMISVSIRFCEI